MILYTDKSETFECSVNVEGTSIENTKARLFLESKKNNLVFYGDVENDGKCKINIGKLDILKEGDSGKMRLEIIADDTVFVPWKDEFHVKTNKKVTVEVIEKNNVKTLSESNKSKVSVNVVPQIELKEQVLNEITKYLKQKKVTLKSLNENKNALVGVIVNNVAKYKDINSKDVEWVIENLII